MDKTQIDSPIEFDTDLFFRQLCVYGFETMGKLIKLRVFLYGLQGVGIEVAKNLILAGPKQVVIQDPSIVTSRDLGNNFFCSEEHVGKVSRAEASLEQLKDLNKYVSVSVDNSNIDTEFLSNFDVIVFTNYYNLDNLIAWNNALRSRENPPAFIVAGSPGLYGYCFVDFGPKFIVVDPTGEEPKTSVVLVVTNDNPVIVYTNDKTRHGLVDGDFVRLREVEGMDGINDKVFKAKVITPHSFSIDCDGTKFKPYKTKGIVEQVKVGKAITFKSLEESLREPVFVDAPDLEKFNRSEELHVALHALYDFFGQNKALPELLSNTQAEEFLKLYRKHLEDSKLSIKENSIQPEELIKNLALYSTTQTTFHSAFWGGIVAQEIVKFTGKFDPICQWLHYENYELLPKVKVDRTLTDGRYDDQIAIFGREFQESIMNKKIFLVGAGALGCEFIKQFALSGIACGKNGQLIVTDDDNIEISNLNRQFLFRKKDVGKSKCETACAVGKKMNPDLNVTALKLRVAPENSSVFDDNFWESQDLIVNAVDNIKARAYIDSRCSFYHKPLIDSGTLGTKCNLQVIIPKETQTYSDSVDPEEESFPFCTVKFFPYMIEHTIQWARDYFEGFFVEEPREFAKFLENPSHYLKQVKHDNASDLGALHAKLSTIEKYGKYMQERTQENCIKIARLAFQELFYNSPNDWITSYPEHSVTTQGTPFWSQLKRFPKVINFDPEDALHVEFMFACANLMCYAFKLPKIEDKNYVAKYASGVQLGEVKAKKMKLEGDKGGAEVTEDYHKLVDDMMSAIPNMKIPEGSEVKETEFEKDDDKNFHVDFISAAANLRARNYQIDEVTKHKVKEIAGKIIPAIATTTAMIVGNVGFEMLKVFDNRPIQEYKNTFCNLALPLFLFSETLPPVFAKDIPFDEVELAPVKVVPSKFSKWDRIDINGPKTLRQIMHEVKEKYGVEVNYVQSGKLTILYIGSKKEYHDLTIEQILEKEGRILDEKTKYIELEISGDIGDAVARMPKFRYIRQ